MSQKVVLYIFKTPKKNISTDILNTKELDRYKKMQSASRKKEFLYSRFLLKSVFKKYHNLKSVNIKYNKNGKPYVSGIKFSLSHSKFHIILAVSKKIEIGVDIELSKNIKGYKKIAQKYFTPMEREYKFKKIWSLKEAYIKASGKKSLRADLLTLQKKNTFLFNEKLNIALCMTGKVQTKNVSVLGLDKALKKKKSKLKFSKVF